MRQSQQGKTVLAIHWARFGPYHLARLQAAHNVLQNTNVEVVGLETAHQDEVYQWRREDQQTTFKRYTFFPERIYDHIPWREMWIETWSQLNRIKPSVIGINGYNSPDAQAMLSWCRLHRCPAILMTESKADDASRSPLKEWFKKRLVRQFSAALCGGTSHRAYLLRLGLSSSQIFMGYDAIDNDYFCQQADFARSDPDRFHHLPGLNNQRPFFLATARFIARKNFDGLLRAYSLYRRHLPETHHRPWRLIILGDGPEKAALEQLAAELQLSDVIWAGFRQIDEIPAYYGLARAFIHPPHQEQWGLVVNEAMAAGLPVLVSQQCGCADDLVLVGQNGYTFPSEDTKQLAKFMVQISTDSEVQERMGVVSRQHIQNWGPTQFAKGLQNAVTVALANRQITI